MTIEFSYLIPEVLYFSYIPYVLRIFFAHDNPQYADCALFYRTALNRNFVQYLLSVCHINTGTTNHRSGVMILILTFCY